MDVKSGYKLTEVGVIPEDWEVSKLGLYSTFKTGPFGSSLHQSDYVEGGIPVINPMQIVDGKIQPTLSMAVSEQAARKLSEFRLSVGDVVIGRRGEMGRCAFVQAKEHGWLCGTGSMIIRTGASLDARFIQRVLSSPPIVTAIENASVGSTMINLNQSTLGNLRVPLPPTKAEQEAIAEALSDADALIESLEQIVAKKRQIKQGAMQELLTGKRRLPGFSGDCDVVEFGDIAAIRNDKVIASSTSSGTQCVEMEFIGQGNGRLLASTEATGTSSKYRFRKGDVLFGRLRAYLRKYWLASFDGVCSTEIWPLIPRDNRLCGKFLHLIVQTNEFVDTAGVSYGTHMPRSDWSVLRKFILRLPPLPEQTAIAAILSDLDAELSALEDKLAKARQLKQGMMQELLTGRIRLV